MKRAFDFYRVPPYPEKPRKKGILIGGDEGLVYPLQKAYLEDYEDLIDMAKFHDHMGTAWRLTEEYFRRKLSLYKQHGIPCFMGGVPFELAFLQDQVMPYFTRIKDLGFSGVEISEDLIPPMPVKKRTALIKEAAKLGLDVYTEWGRKFPDKPFDVKGAVETIKSDLAAGAAKVTIEAGEVQTVMRGESKAADLVRVVEEVGIENVIFECGPGPFPQTPAFLIRTIGPEVNLENLPLTECRTVRAIRLGMHPITRWEFITKS